MNNLVQLENDLAKAKEMIALGEAVQRLQKNRDFKKVMVDVYFTSEPQRLTMLLAAPNVRNEVRTSIHESLQSIAETHSFLNTILSEAERAKDLIAEYEDAIVEERNNEEV